jgi:hypothetical protein
MKRAGYYADITTGMAVLIILILENREQLLIEIYINLNM